jgi:hypothetical protein
MKIRLISAPQLGATDYLAAYGHGRLALSLELVHGSLIINQVVIL